MIGRILVFVLFVLSAAGIYLWQEHIYPFARPWERAESPGSSSATAPASAEPAKQAPSVRARAAGASPAQAFSPPAVTPASPEAVASPPEAVPAPVEAAAAPAPAVKPLPFPMVQQIAPGEAEDEVREKYGDPAISSLTSRDGHVERTYVYHAKRGYSETIIRMEDGRVASAYSKSMPPPPAGLSAPRQVPADKN